MPLRFDHNQQMDGDVQTMEPGRETPLPQYEKTQSVPFTLNLQEDARNPGQFQLVVNVNPRHDSSTAIPLSVASPTGGLAAARDIAKPSSSTPALYQTQKSSPPTTPLQDKQGWSDLDAVPAEFLHKVVPDWNVTFSRSDSTASTQSKRLADIKARIKKKGKGYVVRLLKGSAADTNEIAEIDLGQQSGSSESASHELDSSDLRAELDSTQTSIASRSNDPTTRPDVYEIGTSNEPGIHRWQSNLAQPTFPISGSSRSDRARDVHTISSIAEENLSDAETLIPDVRSIGRRMDEDQTDTESIFHSRPTQPVRSVSVSSIVKTPTRGLSVVGPVRRVGKSNRNRGKNKAQLDLRRSDAHKSMKRRSPHNSVSQSSTGNLYENGLPESLIPGLRERVQSAHRNEVGCDLSPYAVDEWRHPIRETKSIKPRHSRRLSADDLQLPMSQKSKLRLQTNIPRPRSTNASPIMRRKRSLKSHRTVSSSSSSVNSDDSIERVHSSAEWSEVDPSDELREALGKVFRSMGHDEKEKDEDDEDDEEDEEDEDVVERRPLPRIVEPVGQDQVGEIPLPSEVELRSSPVSLQSPTLKFWVLAISALSERVYEGFRLLRDTYGAEPPVSPGHVRVRWTCVSTIISRCLVTS